MFVLELSKPARHLPGGACATGALVGYLHLLALRHGLARHERRGRPRPPPPGHRHRRCSTRCSSASATPRRALHARGPRARTPAAIALYERFGFRAAGLRRRYYQDNGEDAAHHVAHAGDAATAASTTSPNAGPSRATAARVILAHRDELRRHLRGGRQRATARSAPTSSPRQGVHDRYGGVVPEVASRHHLELVNAGRRRRAARAPAPTLDDVDLVAVTAGPGPGRRAARRRRDRQGRSPPRAACRWRPVDHLQGHVAANFLRPRGRRSSRRSCACRQRRPHVPRARRGPRRLHGPRAGRSTTPPARPSTRARGCSGCRFPGGPPLERLAAGRRPATPSPSRRASASPAWTSPSPGSRPRCCTRCATWARRRRAPRAPTSPPPTSTRSSRRSPLRVRARAAQTGPATGWRSAAAWPPTRRCASGSRGLGVELHVPAARAVHRQRGDDRQRRAPAGSARCAATPRSPSTPTRRASATCERRRRRGHALRAARLPPLRRRPRARSSACAPPSSPSRSRRSTSRPTTTLLRRYLERIPVVALDGERALRLLRRRGRPATRGSRSSWRADERSAT